MEINEKSIEELFDLLNKKSKNDPWCTNTELITKIIDLYTDNKLNVNNNYYQKQQEDYFLSVYVSKINLCYRCNSAFKNIIEKLKSSNKPNINYYIDKLIYYDILLTFISNDLPSPPTVHAMNLLSKNLELLLDTHILEALECNLKKNIKVVKKIEIKNDVFYILSACTLHYIKYFIIYLDHMQELFLYIIVIHHLKLHQYGKKFF